MHSNYSFLERSIHTVWLWIFFVFHVWNTDRFAAFLPLKLFRLELKTVVSYLIFIGLSAQLFYDSASTWTTYSEGYIVDPQTGNVVPRPAPLYDASHVTWNLPLAYCLMVGFSMQTAIFFLLQCFYNYMSLAIAQTPFMSRHEFAFYIFWSLISIAMFPVLQATLTFNFNDLINIPELIYAGQLLILSTLSFRTHLKFRNLIEEIRFQKERPKSCPQTAAPPGFILAKLQYFQEMNKILLIAQFLTGASFAILTIGTLDDPIGNIAESKVASDILIGHTNFATAVAWMVTLLILYPRKGFVERPMIEEQEEKIRNSIISAAGQSNRGISVTHAWTNPEDYHLGNALLDEDDSDEHWHTRPITNPVELPMESFPHMHSDHETYGDASRNAEIVQRSSDDKAKSFVASASIASSPHSKKRSNTPRSILAASQKTKSEDGEPLTLRQDVVSSPFGAPTASPSHPAFMQPAVISPRGRTSTTEADDAAEWLGIGLEMRRRLSNASIQTSSTITHLDEILDQSKTASDERIPTTASNRSSPPFEYGQERMESPSAGSRRSPLLLHPPLPPASPFFKESINIEDPMNSQRSYMDDGASSFHASAVYHDRPKSHNSAHVALSHMTDDVSMYSQSTAPEPTLALQQRLYAVHHKREMSILSDSISMYSQDTADVPEQLGRRSVGYRHQSERGKRNRSMSPQRRLSAISSSRSGTLSDPASNAEIRTVISRTSNKEDVPLSPGFVKGTLKFMPKMGRR